MGGKHQQPRPGGGSRVPVNSQPSHSNSSSHSAQTPSDSPNTAVNSQTNNALQDQLSQIAEEAMQLVDSITGDVPPSSNPALGGNEEGHMYDLEYGVPSSQVSGAIESAGDPQYEQNTYGSIFDQVGSIVDQVSDTITEPSRHATSTFSGIIDDLNDIPHSIESAFSGIPDQFETELGTVNQKVQNVWGDIERPLHGFTSDLKSDIKEVAIVGAIAVGILWLSTSKQRNAAVNYGKNLAKRSFDEFAQQAPKALPLAFL